MSKAVVLSGGGPLAVAWQAGLISGYFQSGLALVDADFFLGTSAGAIVGAQIATGRNPVEMADAILNEKPSPGPNTTSPAMATALSALPGLFQQAQRSEQDRIEVAAHALANGSVDDLMTHVTRFSAIVGADGWSDNIGIVAVDTANGNPRVLRRDCGVPLGTAVAASCSLPGLHPPVPIGERSYIDGGLRSTANADLVGRFDDVLILSFQPQAMAGERIASRVGVQSADLATKGIQVLTISPDTFCLEVLGFGGHRFSLRPEVVRRAMRQGLETFETIARFWN